MAGHIIRRLRDPEFGAETTERNLMFEAAYCLDVFVEFFDAFEERKNAYLDGTNEARISLSQKRFRKAHDAAINLRGKV